MGKQRGCCQFGDVFKELLSCKLGCVMLPSLPNLLTEIEVYSPVRIQSRGSDDNVMGETTMLSLLSVIRKNHLMRKTKSVGRSQIIIDKFSP